MYTYKSFEPGLYTVGFYDPTGKWNPESDWENIEDAINQVKSLNGGNIKQNEPAFPYHTSTLTQHTKREYFAAMAMNGILSRNPNNPSAKVDEVVKLSICYADEVLKQLNQ